MLLLTNTHIKNIKVQYIYRLWLIETNYEDYLRRVREFLTFLDGDATVAGGNVGNDNKSIVSNVNTLMSLMRQNIEKRSEDSGCDLNESNNESSHSHAGKA